MSRRCGFPADVVAELRTVAAGVVCLAATDEFGSVGDRYDDFEPVSDQDVTGVLNPTVIVFVQEEQSQRTVELLPRLLAEQRLRMRTSATTTERIRLRLCPALSISTRSSSALQASMPCSVSSSHGGTRS